MYLIKLLVFFTFLIYNVQSAKILTVFPIASKSHYILGKALLKELAIRGHEVTMVSPFTLDEPVKNFREIFLENSHDALNTYITPFMNSDKSMLEKTMLMYPNLKAIIKSPFESKNFKQLLNSGEKFDLYMHFSIFNEAYLGLAHLFNATSVGFSIVGINPWISFMSGNPHPPAYVVSPFLNAGPLSFMQRVANVLSYGFLYGIQNFVNLPLQRSLLNEFFPSAPPLEKLIDDVGVYLINSHYATEAVRPFLPNVIQIGGFHLQEKNDLPNDLKVFLDESKNGVILFTFGTNIKSANLSQTMVKDMLKTFSQTKLNILWKFDDELPNKPKNVRIAKWLPQRDILAHPNVKLFITHGGLGGTVEAIYHGVPMICIPFFGDQETNAINTASQGYGIYLKLEEINEQTFTNAINEVTNNATYRNNIQLRSDIYKNQEMNPLDKAVYWIEHVIKHKGAKHLKTNTAHLNFLQMISVDVYAFLIGVSLLCIFIFFMFTKCIIKCCCQKKKITKVKRN